jgi:hypothetical protein
MGVLFVSNSPDGVRATIICLSPHGGLNHPLGKLNSALAL